MRFVADFRARLAAEDERQEISAAEAAQSFEYRLDRLLASESLAWARTHLGRVGELAGLKLTRMWNVWPNEARPAQLAAAGHHFGDVPAAAAGRPVGRVAVFDRRLAICAGLAAGRLFHAAAYRVRQFDSVSRAGDARLGGAGRRSYRGPVEPARERSRAGHDHLTLDALTLDVLTHEPQTTQTSKLFGTQGSRPLPRDWSTAVGSASSGGWY